MGFFSFLAPLVMMVLAFIIAVAAGSVNVDRGDLSPVSALSALLVAAFLMVVQAVLWAMYGASIRGGF